MAAFGLSQRNKPTPERINVLSKVITATIGIFIGWTGTNDILPAKLENILTSVLGLFLLVIPVITPLFGVDVPTATVPTKDVTAIETDPK